MKVNFDHETTTYTIMEQIASIPESLERERKQIINKSAKIIKGKVEGKLRRIESDIPSTASNYDGSTPYIHMVNDVKTSVKDDQIGSVYAIIQGGKYTGYKWHMVNNGTSDTDATHFIDEAMDEAEAEIDAIVDEALRKVAQSGN